MHAVGHALWSSAEVPGALCGVDEKWGSGLEALSLRYRVDKLTGTKASLKQRRDECWSTLVVLFDKVIHNTSSEDRDLCC